MPKLTDTYHLAYACCDRVLQETERFPTIDSIRERIGINSPTTIKKAMNDWTVAFAQKHFDALQRPELPSVLWDATERLWTLAVKQANQTFEAERAQLQAAQQDGQKQVQAAQAKAETLQDALTDAQRHIEQLTQAAERQQQQLKQLTDARDAAEQAEAEKRRALEQQQRAHATELAQLKQHQQQEADWAQRRIAEERDLAAEKWQSKLSQAEALAQAQQQATVQIRQALQRSEAQAQGLQQHCLRLEQALAKAQQDAAQPTWKTAAVRSRRTKDR